MSSLTPSERASAHHDYELTSDEEEKFTDLFNRLDTNKDGRIDIHDLSEALKTMRVPQVEDHARVSILLFVQHGLCTCYQPKKAKNP